jgi:ornithine decarboxylase
MEIFHSPDVAIRRSRPDVPVACFRPQALATAAHWFTRNIPGKTLYAVKANPAPYVLKGLFGAGVTAFDAASVPEIKLVQETCPGAFIAFMHPVKSRTAIEQAYFDHGVRDFAFDSADELEKITASTGNSKDLSLILRLAVPNTASEMPLSGKFGAAPEKAADLLKAARKVARKLGVSFHVGSQTMDPHAYVTALSVAGDVMRAAGRTRVDIIDVGGGFPAAYPGMTPPPLVDYAAAIAQGLELLPQNAKRDVWCEPGRALVAESGSVIVRVELRKEATLYINDGTYGSLFDAGHMGFRYPVRLLGDHGHGNLKPFSFYGPTCDSIDFMQCHAHRFQRLFGL